MNIEEFERLSLEYAAVKEQRKQTAFHNAQIETQKSGLNNLPSALLLFAFMFLLVGMCGKYEPIQGWLIIGLFIAVMYLGTSFLMAINFQT